MKAWLAIAVLACAIPIMGMGGCQGKTSVGVSGETVVVDTDDSLIQIHDGQASQCGTGTCTQTPIACPLLSPTGEVVCSCDSFFAGEC